MTWDELQQKQMHLQRQLEERDRLYKQVVQYKLQQKQLLKRQSILQAEQQVYENKIAHFNKQTFWQRLANRNGKLDQKVEQKEMQLAQIIIKLQEVQQLLQFTQAQITQVEAKRAQGLNTDDLLAEVQQLRTKKRLYVMQYQPAQAEQLAELEDQQANAIRLLYEVEEAIEAGQKAKQLIAMLMQQLDTARGYSAWDLFGGGLFITHLKHSEIDKVKSILPNVHAALQQFQNELLDVDHYEISAVNVDTDGFVKFADYFFDDIFSAWSVNSQLAEAQKNVIQLQDNVDNTLRRLCVKQEEVTAYQVNVKKAQDTLLQTL